MNMAANSMHQWQLVDVLSAESQVVAGMNYKLQLRVQISPENQNDFEVFVYVDPSRTFNVQRFNKL